MERYQFDPAQFSLMESSVIPLAVYQFIDKRVVSLVISDGFCRMFGYDRKEVYELMDHNMYRDVHPGDVARISDAAFRFAAEDEDYDVIYRFLKNGTYRIVHARGEHIYTETGVRLAVLHYTDEGVYTENEDEYIHDLHAIFNRSLHEEALLKNTYYDHLTGLPNMTYFFELAEMGKKRMITEGKNPVMLFFDLSGMKFFNRKYGFAEGDRLIREVSRVLVRYFSLENCSRFGQDHFAAFTDAERLEERLDALIRDCASINDGNSLPIRIGIYLGGMGPVEASAACDRARYACDMDRDTYRSRYTYFSREMLEEGEKYQYFVDNLDRALQEGWIHVYYQPIIRAANGRVCDEEALARWIDPEKGVISPGDFIPVLEETRLIYKLDLYVLDRVLKKLKAQQKAGLYLVPQSLNLSRNDFDAGDIVEIIRRKVDEAGIDRSKITIEITESAVGSDFEFMKEQVRRFQDLGFQVWMDDFGSGYSSLDVLQNIHFNLLKFDMRFMQRFFEGEESRIIMTELARMAIALGVETVCEGVEHPEQVEFLREIGVTKLQGYYYCKPIPPEEIMERYRTGRAIGFENPAETEYYEAIGRINLYDMSSVAHDDSREFEQYFNTIPMAVVESSETELKIVRCNSSFQSYIERMMNSIPIGEVIRYEDIPGQAGDAMLNSIRQCVQKGGRIIMDEEVRNSTMIHAIIRRIAVNPVKGNAAMVIAILAISDSRETHQAVTYTSIARALSSDYTYLYYVNLDTDQFVEFSSEKGYGELSLERHGEDFFLSAVRDSRTILQREDQAEFARVFTKENILSSIREHGLFQITYRQLVNGHPRYMQMKGMRMQDDDSHIVIGVSDVDTQVKEKNDYDRMREERITNSRIAALAGDFQVLYTVDPETGRYTEYNASSAYEGLGLLKEGEDFFEDSKQNSKSHVHPDDLDRFLPRMEKQNILSAIRENGSFSVNYRLLLDGKPVPVRLRAVPVTEDGGMRILIGVSRVDS